MNEEERKMGYFQSEPIDETILEKMEECRKKRMIVPDEDIIKRPSHIAGIREAGRVNTLVLDAVAENIHAGMSTQDIDDIVAMKMVASAHALATRAFRKMYVLPSMMKYVMAFLPATDTCMMVTLSMWTAQPLWMATMVTQAACS